MVEDGDFLKQDLIEAICIVCKKHPTFVNLQNLMSLRLIDNFSLYKYNIISDDILSNMLFESLQNYKEDDNQNQLATFSLQMIEQLLKDKIAFVDSGIVIQFLSNVYIENSENIELTNKVIKMIESFGDTLRSYNVKDISLFIRRLLISNSLCKDFLECYFKVVPEVKNEIVKHLSSSIKLELKLREIAIEKDPDYETESPLVEFFTMVTKKFTTHNLKGEEDKPKTMIADCKLNPDDFTVELIEKMLHCKSYSDFKCEIMLCHICFTNNINMAYSPCGHLICEGCYSILPKKDKCPTCSTINVKVTKLFFIS
jgi:hypothetical protein